MKPLIIFVLIGLANVFFSCSTSVEKTDQNVATSDVLYFDQIYSRDSLNPLLTKYTPFTLTTDMSKLSENEKKLIGKLIEAGEIIEDLFWYESYGDKDELLNSIKDEDLKTFTKINYGPWDRLDGNSSFIDGID
ncbi:MAG: Zn-dependent hydrolase, partial [Saprospiraceae bacterium]|nr:Zn-dependent hydrolase [Saprospiraceae bacterium]